MNRTLSRVLSLLVACQLVLLTGCKLPSDQPVPTPTAALTEAPTPVKEQPLPVGGAYASTPPSVSEPPLRFTLPTPVSAPISLWRPPLYDTPWALGPHDHFYFNRPIAADEVNWPLADYRYGGIFFGVNIVHTGVDIPAPRDTPVIAAASGKVIWAGYGLYYGTNSPKDPYGLAVTIRHDFGFEGQRLYTVYAHMDRLNVVSGQEVETGDVLGFVGTTGNTTGPHLHFEVRTDRNSYFTTLNPELWLAPPQGWGVLVGHLENTNRSMLIEHDVVVRNKETGQKWVVRSYGNNSVNSDPYYNENVVLSDLPAGQYQITINYDEEQETLDIEIRPGAVSYFRFRGKLLFDTSLPRVPSVEQLLGEK